MQPAQHCCRVVSASQASAHFTEAVILAVQWRFAAVWMPPEKTCWSRTRSIERARAEASEPDMERRPWRLSRRNPASDLPSWTASVADLWQHEERPHPAFDSGGLDL